MNEVDIWPTGPTRRFPLPPVPWPLPYVAPSPASDSWCRPCRAWTADSWLPDKVTRKYFVKVYSL